jgi:F-type H+-transporting ATPase subunit a
MNELLASSADPLSHVVQHTLWQIDFDIVPMLPGWLSWLPAPFGSFPIVSNHIIMQLATAALIVWLLPKAARMRAGDDAIGRLVPRGFGNAIEATCVALREVVFKPNLGKSADAFTPFLWSMFFFLLVSNLLGMLPLSAIFYGEAFHHQIGGTSTANLWVTGGLAAMVLVMMVYNGLKTNGLDYIKHFFMGPFPISLLIAFIELLGLFFKAMALAIRLFANMLAGHVMLAVLMSFVGAAFSANAGGGVLIGIVVWAASVLLNFLEIFVAFLHAFIFTLLTAVFLGMSINIHHDDEHEHEEAHAAAAHG